MNLTAIIEDSNDYTMNVTCYNSTAFLNSTTRSGITIDTSIPTGALSLSPPNNYLQSNTTSIAFSGTVDGFNTTSCNLLLNRQGVRNTYAMTHSGNSCSYNLDAFNDISLNDIYTYTIQSSDGTNYTNSSASSFQLWITPSAGGVGGSQQASQLAKQQALAIGGNTEGDSSIGVGLLIILSIIVIGYMLTKKK